MKKRKYYASYTAIFLAVSFGVYIWFIFGKRTFIWHADGWNEYYKALVYYAQYLRSILRELLLNHRLEIPNWDFSLGEGSDILQTLQCFGIGDPIVALSVFVPADFLHLFYSISALFRLYLAGVAFSELCFKMDCNNYFAVLAGAMAYVFSHWGIYHVSIHPYFITPLICLPLLILGIEKIIKKESPLFFSVAVFLAAISNFYFFYMLVLMTVIYVLARLTYLYRKEIKSAIGVFWSISWSALLGVGMSAIILAPVCYTFLENDRVGGITNFRYLFYPLQYYSQLFGIYLTEKNTYSLHMGFAVPVLLATFLLFYKKKEHKFLKILFLMNVAFIVFPVFGQIFNGFSYMSGRWCFAFTLLSAFVLTVMWPTLVQRGQGECRMLFVCTTCYFGLCMLAEYSRTISTFSAIAVCYVLILILALGEGTNSAFFTVGKRSIAVFTILLISILQISFWRYSSAEGASNTASEGMEAKNVWYRVLKMNEAESIKNYTELTDPDHAFYRYTGRGLTKNAGQLSDISSTQYYYSFSNPYISKYRNELELLETGQSFSYEGYDDRPFLLSLASVRYYAAQYQNNAQLPYGLQHVWTTNVKESLTQKAEDALKTELGTNQINERQAAEIRGLTASWWDVYENKYCLPLAYSYESFILEDDWRNLSAVEKQEAMMETVYLEEPPSYVQEKSPTLTSREIPFEITCDSTEVSRQGNAFIVTAPGASVTLSFEGMPNCETYFSIRGLDFEGISYHELYFGDEAVDPYNIYNETTWDLLSYDRKKSIKREKAFSIPVEETGITLTASNGSYGMMPYKTQDYAWYSDRHDFTANMSYSEEAIKTLTMSFQQIGVYRFDEMTVICQPMEYYEQRIDNLKKDTIDKVYIDNDRVYGTLSASAPKMVCFSIPYSDGWKAYVDGNEVKLHHANIAYMAIEIESGEHQYELVYETPLQKSGMYISVVSLSIFFAIFMFRKRRIFRIGRDILK